MVRIQYMLIGIGLCSSTIAHAHPTIQLKVLHHSTLPHLVAQAPGPDLYLEPDDAGGIVEIQPIYQAAPSPSPRPQFQLVQDPCGEAILRARRKRLAGILVTSVGSGLGLILTTVGVMLNTQESVYYFRTSDSADHTDSRNLIYAGLATFGVSLAVGIPLWVSGQRDVTALRQGMWQNFQPVTLLGAGQASFGLAGKF
jgi:hypothetical protein